MKFEIRDNKKDEVTEWWVEKKFEYIWVFASNGVKKWSVARIDSDGIKLSPNITADLGFDKDDENRIKLIK